MVGTLPSSAGAVGSIPGRGAKSPHASGPKNQNIEQKQYSNKFNKDFKNKKWSTAKKMFKKKKKRFWVNKRQCSAQEHSDESCLDDRKSGFPFIR